VELPAEVTLSEALKVAGCARVLRIERSAGGVIGMAVQIADFDCHGLPESQPKRGAAVIATSPWLTSDRRFSFWLPVSNC
jgi:hypothetical protein